MIAFLRGVLHSVSGIQAVIDVQGVGYAVFCSAQCLAVLQPGEQAELVIFTDVKQDGINLYGFVDNLEKQVFRLLLQVKGVGARSALDIISKIEKRELLRVIGAGDLSRLQAVKGIGRKTAERIIVELKDKVAEYALGGFEPSGSRSAGLLEPFTEAVEALQALGFAKREAEQAVRQVEVAAGKRVDNAMIETAEVVKEALKFV